LPSHEVSKVCLEDKRHMASTAVNEQHRISYRSHADLLNNSEV